MPKRYKVLVADDDVDHVTIVRTILEQHGYESLEAFNGEEALNAIAQQEPDLVLLDIMMPKLDGLEVMRRLKDDPKTRDLPVIMFSAKSGTREIMESFNYGASNYLIKPIDTGRLLEKIEGTLRKVEFRENMEKRYQGARDSAVPPGASAADSGPRKLGELAQSVNRFISGVDPALDELHKRVVELTGTGPVEREFRLVTKKLDAISALCAELKDFVSEIEEA